MSTMFDILWSSVIMFLNSLRYLSFGVSNLMAYIFTLCLISILIYINRKAIK